MSTPFSPLSLPQHLQTLYLLHPVSTLVHAGPGLTAGKAWYSHWPEVTVHWVEADPQRHQHLQQQAASGQTAHHALLGSKALEEATWHTLSNPNESGLLPASSLTALWPNIHSVAEQAMPQTTLDALLPTPTAGQWLVVDCLPALAILQGASQHLPHTAVIVARATAHTAAGLKDQGASLQELRDHLQPQGFALLAQEEERNPAYVQAVFVRNYAQLHQQEQQQHQASTAKLTAELKQAQTQAAEQQKAAESLQTKLSTELQQAQAQIAEQQVCAATLQAELQKTKQDKDAQAKAKAGLQAQLSQLQAEQAETQQRQTMIDEELRRAEEQLKLLEELLLDEQQDQFALTTQPSAASNTPEQ